MNSWVLSNGIQFNIWSDFDDWILFDSINLFFVLANNIWVFNLVQYLVSFKHWYMLNLVKFWQRYLRLKIIDTISNWALSSINDSKIIDIMKKQITLWRTQKWCFVYISDNLLNLCLNGWKSWSRFDRRKYVELFHSKCFSNSHG